MIGRTGHRGHLDGASRWGSGRWFRGPAGVDDDVSVQRVPVIRAGRIIMADISTAHWWASARWRRIAAMVPAPVYEVLLSTVALVVPSW